MEIRFSWGKLSGQSAGWNAPQTITAISSVLVALLIGTFGVIWSIRTDSLNSDEKWNAAALQIFDKMLELEQSDGVGQQGPDAQGVVSARRLVLLLRLDDLLALRPNTVTISPKMMSLFATSYARAGYVEKAKEYWEKSLADDQASILPINIPSAIQLRAAAERKVDEVRTSRERLKRLIEQTPDAEAALHFYMSWAELESRNREFSYALDLSTKAVERFGETNCAPRVRKEQRSMIGSFLCTVEYKFPERTAVLLHQIYAIAPSDPKYCPGDLDIAPTPGPELIGRYCATLGPLFNVGGGVNQNQLP
jgi:tetratricopeptide (TPR) repeat protein